MNHPRPDRTDPVDVDNPFLLSPSPPPLTSAPPHAIPSTWSIEKLQNRSSRLIASTLRLPSLGAILDCLLWNSLQAGANKVDVWLDVSGESYAGRGGVAGEVREVRLEVGDDGCGIGRWGLDEVGEWGGDGEEGEEGEGEGGGGDETRGGRSEVCPNEAPAGAGSAGYGSCKSCIRRSLGVYEVPQWWCCRSELKCSTRLYSPVQSARDYHLLHLRLPLRYCFLSNTQPFRSIPSTTHYRQSDHPHCDLPKYPISPSSLFDTACWWDLVSLSEDHKGRQDTVLRTVKAGIEHGAGYDGDSEGRILQRGYIPVYSMPTL